VIPVLGSTALLCTLAAIAFPSTWRRFRLSTGWYNPLQLILLIPFYASVDGSSDSAVRAFRSSYPRIDPHGNVLHAIATLWTITIHAVVAWLVLGSIATGLLYLLLVPGALRHAQQLRPATGE